MLTACCCLSVIGAFCDFQDLFLACYNMLHCVLSLPSAFSLQFWRTELELRKWAGPRNSRCLIIFKDLLTQCKSKIHDTLCISVGWSKRQSFQWLLPNVSYRYSGCILQHCSSLLSNLLICGKSLSSSGREVEDVCYSLYLWPWGFGFLIAFHLV